MLVGSLFILGLSFSTKAQEVVEHISVAGSNEQWYAEGKERASDAASRAIFADGQLYGSKTVRK